MRNASRHIVAIAAAGAGFVANGLGGRKKETAIVEFFFALIALGREILAALSKQQRGGDGWIGGDDLGFWVLRLPSGPPLRPDRIHDLSTSIQTAVPETSTRVIVLYRFSNSFAPLTWISRRPNRCSTRIPPC